MRFSEKTQRMLVRLMQLALVAFFIGVYLLNNVYAQGDQRKYIGEYKGVPIYAEIDPSGGLEITFSEVPPERCSPPLFTACATYVDIYINFSGVEKFNPKPITFDREKNKAKK
jgi:hypothetical protein